MGSKTALFDKHVEAGARIVDFGGWDMPLNYGSQKEEHHAVRNSAGMFDVSHMTIVDLHGDKVRELLRYLLANDVAKLQSQGKALYSCMLKDTGGVVDDLIVYYLDESFFRLIVNAATRGKDLVWLRQLATGYDVAVRERADLAMIAVQGPKSRELAAPSIDDAWRGQALALKPFTGIHAGELFVARTGYTGEDGWEVIMPAALAAGFWDRWLAAGVVPCGLGARDTLRLEAAMSLYGNDMDESVSPLESGLGWTIAWQPAERDFIGRAALEVLRNDPTLRRFVGLLLEDPGVLRAQQRIIVEGFGEGEVTSGGYSPTIGRSIGLARIPAGEYSRVKVEVRGKLLTARIVKTPFVRNGKILIDT